MRVLTGKDWLEWLRRFGRRLEIQPTVYEPVNYIIRAPWNDEQVEQLNRYQKMGLMHPYTCGSTHRRSLVATAEGWHCPVRDCEYVQDWAHTQMANRQLLDEMQSSRSSFYLYAENDD